MPRHVVALITVSTVTWSFAALASAQGVRPGPVLMTQQASVRNGRVHGSVHDDTGRAVAGASVVALGPAPLPLMARSDTTGQFRLALPPGEYVLRASRDGYVSTYRELLRIQSSTELERNITLVRQGAVPSGRVVLASAVGGLDMLPEEPVSLAGKDTESGHDETAWRLRHLAPTALKDITDSESLIASKGSAQFKPRSSLVDWIMEGSARAATSFFVNTNFSGQVNFLTTGSLAPTMGWIPTTLPRGVASVAVGAPVGSRGDWRVRGAMIAGSLSSWVVLGEYAAKSDQPHAFSAGLSFSSQLAQNNSDLTPAAVNDRVRSVGGIYGSDHWTVRPGVQLDYGLRLDRYDYVAGSEFLSPRVGLRALVLPQTNVTLLVSESSLAPGAEEFLPPPSAGPWLPPERTFGSLVPTAVFRAERVRNYVVGIEHQWGSTEDSPSVGLRRFRQTTNDQIATLFGLDPASDLGHYDVATPGDVEVKGWAVHVGGRLAPRVKGWVDYSVSDARWTRGLESIAIASVAPSVGRLGRERLHDVTTSVDGTIPETSTRVLIAYRLNTTFGRAAVVSSVPLLDGRFDVEVHQALPLHPTRGSRTDLLITVRNLYRDFSETASMYDELLTVAPPLRIMGGVQIRF